MKLFWLVCVVSLVLPAQPKLVTHKQGTGGKSSALNAGVTTAPTSERPHAKASAAGTSDLLAQKNLIANKFLLATNGVKYLKESVERARRITSEPRVEEKKEPKENAKNVKTDTRHDKKIVTEIGGHVYELSFQAQSQRALAVSTSGSHGAAPPLPVGDPTHEHVRTLEKLRAREIIGDDDNRSRVTNVNVYPYNSVVYIKNGCTGGLIAPNVVLTAAHCIWDADDETWEPLSELSVSVARNGNPPNYIRAKEKYISQIYFDRAEYDAPYDWGVIVLVRNGGSDHFGVRSRDGLGDTHLNIAGYPQDKSNQMWHSTNCRVIDKYWTTEGHHECDTKPGNSGSPMWKMADGSAYIECIHSGYDGWSITDGFENQCYMIASGSVDVWREIIAEAASTSS